ncbi:MAG: M48 family metallopeptidase, partial [Cyanobacteria bacterium P01_E01_bin.34]
MKTWQWKRAWLPWHEPLGWRWLRKVVIVTALLFMFVHHTWTTPVRAQHGNFSAGNHTIGGAELSIDYSIDGSSAIYFNRWFEVPPSQALLQKLVTTVERISPNCQAEWGAPYSDDYSFSHVLNCDRASLRSGFAQQSQLNLQPLLVMLRHSGTTNLNMSISIPDVLPFHSLPARFQPIASINWLGDNSSQFSSSIDLAGDVETESFHIEYGYRWSNVQRMTIPLVAIALLAPLLTTVGQRWALRSMQATDKTVGFQFQMYHSVSVLLVWGSWALAVLGMQWQNLMDLVTSALPAWGPPAVGFMGLAVFPAAICLLCRWIAYPVIARVGRVKPTLRNVLLEGAIEQGLIADAFAICIAIPLVMRGEIRLAILWFVGVAASAFVFKLLQAQITGLIPQSITVGPLRDRVFELAQVAEVDIEQLYVLPTRKTKVANAFAVSGGVVMLTDYLLENLTKREVDAVIAHELSHFERNHHASQSTLMTVAGVLIFASSIWNPGNYFGLFLALSILGLGGAFAGQMHQSRRHEYEADWGAAKLTGDPEAMISALASITELAEMPAMWNPLAEALGTHPSLQNRANAIAQAYDIPAERVEQLLLTPDFKRETYSIPNSSEQLVYSSEVKSDNALKATTLLTCTAVAVSLGIVLLCQILLPSLSYVPIAVASMASFMALLWISNRIAQLGMKSLDAQLRNKFEQQGLAAGDLPGVLAGFSPNLQPHLYEGSLFWDTGLLYLDPKNLAYVGIALKRSRN